MLASKHIERTGGFLGCVLEDGRIMKGVEGELR